MFNQQQQTPYQILGVTLADSDEKIRKQYKILVLQYHPDKNPEGAEKFKEIVNAYEILSDKEKRKKLDYDIKSGSYYKESDSTPFMQPDIVLQFSTQSFFQSFSNHNEQQTLFNVNQAVRDAQLSSEDLFKLLKSNLALAEAFLLHNHRQIPNYIQKAELLQHVVMALSQGDGSKLDEMCSNEELTQLMFELYQFELTCEKIIELGEKSLSVAKNILSKYSKLIKTAVKYQWLIKHDELLPLYLSEIPIKEFSVRQLQELSTKDGGKIPAIKSQLDIYEHLCNLLKGQIQDQEKALVKKDLQELGYEISFTLAKENVQVAIWLAELLNESHESIRALQPPEFSALMKKIRV